MKLWIKLATIFLSAAPILAFAACEPTPAEFLPAFAESALSARAKAYAKACAENPLHDMDDKRLAPRAGLGPDSGNPGKTINDDFIKLLPPGTVEPNQQTTTLVSLVIEPDGRISETTVVGKSGNRKYDSEVLAALRRAKKYAVMTVDGQPVRAFLTMTFAVGTGRR